MINNQVKENIIEKVKTEKNTFPLFLLEYTKFSTTHYWYKGIVSEEDTTTEDNNSIKILDKGDAIEFILPKATALFAEISIKDIEGNLVWKTQTFNKNRIVWYKQTIIGKSLPRGKYYLQITQGEIVVRGIAII